MTKTFQPIKTLLALGVVLLIIGCSAPSVAFGEKIDKAGWNQPWDITSPTLKNGSVQQQCYIHYAWKYHDIEFIYMLAGENGLFTPDRKSDVKNEDSWGFCQLNRIWHSDTVDDPRFLSDPYWQIDQCYEHWKGGTKFYGYNSRWITKTLFDL